MALWKQKIKVFTMLMLLNMIQMVYVLTYGLSSWWNVLEFSIKPHHPCGLSSILYEAHGWYGLIWSRLMDQVHNKTFLLWINSMSKRWTLWTILSHINNVINILRVNVEKYPLVWEFCQFGALSFKLLNKVQIFIGGKIIFPTNI